MLLPKKKLEAQLSSRDKE